MARGIIFKNNGINELSSSPTGYKFIGYDGEVISEKSGATVSSIGGGSSVNYTEYKALITQTSTSAPTASVLNNTLGSGSWSYQDIGVYYFTLSSAFSDISKVEVFIPGSSVLGYTMTNQAFNLYSISRIDSNIIEVRTGQVWNDGTSNNYAKFNGITGVTDLLVNGLLSYTPITIRVWS